MGIILSPIQLQLLSQIQQQPGSKNIKAAALSRQHSKLGHIHEEVPILLHQCSVNAVNLEFYQSLQEEQPYDTPIDCPDGPVYVPQ